MHWIQPKRLQSKPQVQSEGPVCIIQQFVARREARRRDQTQEHVPIWDIRNDESDEIQNITMSQTVHDEPDVAICDLEPEPTFAVL